ncbi:hypothetical protein [Bacillus cereus]|nr:hypothetical protein [Bacillus cereus]
MQLGYFKVTLNMLVNYFLLFAVKVALVANGNLSGVSILVPYPYGTLVSI